MTDFNEPLTNGSPSAAHPAPTVVTVRYCDNCEADVEPVGKGNCPGCGRTLPGNTIALIHGGRRAEHPQDRENRRIALRAKVHAELGGNLPPIITEIAEDFVSACVRRDQVDDFLDDVGPLTARGTRRTAIDLSIAISASIRQSSEKLNAYRDALTHTPTTLPSLDTVPTSALELAHALLSRQSQGEVLTEREQGQLDVLQSAMRGVIALTPDPPSAAADDDDPADPSVRANQNDAAASVLKTAREQSLYPTPDLTPAPETGASEAIPGLALGGPEAATATTTAAAIKAQKDRDAYATAEMFHQIGKPLPRWYTD